MTGGTGKHQLEKVIRYCPKMAIVEVNNVLAAAEHHTGSLYRRNTLRHSAFAITLNAYRVWGTQKTVFRCLQSIIGEASI